MQKASSIFPLKSCLTYSSGLLLTFLTIFTSCFIGLQSELSAQVTVLESRYDMGAIPSNTGKIEIFFFNSSSEVIDKIEHINGELSFLLGSDLNLRPGQYVKLVLPINSWYGKNIKETLTFKVDDEEDLITIQLKGKRTSFKNSDQDCPDFSNSGRIKKPSSRSNQKKLSANSARIKIQLVDNNLIGKKALDTKTYKLNNLILLIDASSSMLDQRKKALVDEAFEGLAEILRPSDQLTVLTYSDKTHVIFKTSRNINFTHLTKSLKSIEKRGITNGSNGIEQAYILADSIFMAGGNNEIILLTDGAFNANETDSISENIIQKYKVGGTRLSIIGIDNQSWAAKEMKELTDVGNGKYVSVKSLRSARNAIKRTVKNHARK